MLSSQKWHNALEWSVWCGLMWLAAVMMNTEKVFFSS